MIAYFDTSALVPLVVREAGSASAWRVWHAADRVVSVRLVYVEARAALAAAHRAGRVPDRGLRKAVVVLEELIRRLHHVDVDASLVRQAGELAQMRSLRGYDAVHLAAASRVSGDEVLFVAGDRALCAAAAGVGLQVSEL